jgi:hypothetical protein
MAVKIEPVAATAEASAASPCMMQPAIQRVRCR